MPSQPFGHLVRQCAPLERAGLQLDPATLGLSWGGRAVTLSVQEWLIAYWLAARPGVILTRDDLLDRLEDTGQREERCIDQVVKRLRRALRRVDPGFREIEAVVGFGYRWRPAS